MGDGGKRAIALNGRDNVAVVLARCERSDRIEVFSKEGILVERLTAVSTVERGHKVALAELAEGDGVIKYGEVIGAVSRPVARGDFVHAHNMESCRGRGDHAQQ